MTISVKNDSQLRNGRSSTEPLLSSDESNKEHNEDDTEIKVDLPSISTELQREPIVKWEVGHINVTDRFRQYQKEIINKTEMKGLKYDNIYELLYSFVIDYCPLLAMTISFLVYNSRMKISYKK
ncbi:unnamed protein product [Rhizophagus irregularis]|nr:unnamed protein product [Rhizophagus irregularis]